MYKLTSSKPGITLTLRKSLKKKAFPLEGLSHGNTFGNYLPTTNAGCVRSAVLIGRSKRRKRSGNILVA